MYIEYELHTHTTASATHNELILIIHTLPGTPLGR